MRAYPSIVRGVPYTPPRPKVADWRGYVHRVIGWDGSDWIISDHEGGVLLTPEVEGMDVPEWDRYTSTSPHVAGSRYRGSRTQERRVSWNVLVWSDNNSVEWLERDRAFMGLWRTDKVNTWEVTTPDGMIRRLPVRSVRKPAVYGMDPAEAGWALYQIEMVAEDPYWRRDPVRRSWDGHAPVPLVPDVGEPLVPIRVGSSAGYAAATADNPGEVAAWPVWEMRGPIQGVTVTVDGGTLGVPNLADGQVLVIDTDPRWSCARRDGVDVAGLIDPWDPRPIPPGEAVPVTIEWAGGTGGIAMQIIPRDLRGV